jgi:hypothetical protein
MQTAACEEIRSWFDKLTTNGLPRTDFANRRPHAGHRVYYEAQVRGWISLLG